VREGASERSEREHDDAELKDPPEADQFAHCGHRKKRYDGGELIGVDHPYGFCNRRVQVCRDRRKGDVGDRTVEDGKRESQMVAAAQ
jgi:hypothetical protein